MSETRPHSGLWFEELVPGRVVQHAIRRTLTEADNVLFTSMTMNPAWLHLDHDYAANETEFGRPLVNSLLTLAVVVGILLFGGSALNPFSFVLTVGVIVGTYSSIWVASPLLVLWQNYKDSRGSKDAKASDRVDAGTRDELQQAAGSYVSQLALGSGMLRFVEFLPHDEGVFTPLHEALDAETPQ